MKKFILRLIHLLCSPIVIVYGFIFLVAIAFMEYLGEDKPFFKTVKRYVKEGWETWWYGF